MLRVYSTQYIIVTNSTASINTEDIIYNDVAKLKIVKRS